MFMVNAVIYPNIFAWALARIFFFDAFEATFTLYIRTIDMVKDKFMEARMWAFICIKTWMLERKARVPVALQTHKGNEI